MNFLKRDLKEEAKIARKRQNEAERKKRIFNPRTRIFGVDVKAWNEQVHERKCKEEQEKQIQQKYVQKIIQDDALCVLKEKELKKQRRDIEKKIQTFRENHQQPRDRREYELNHSEYIKHAVCASNGVSKFVGEDNSYKDRVHRQKEQTRAWLLQQMEEKKRIKDSNRDFEALQAEKQIAQDTRALQLAMLDEKCRRQLDTATAYFNKIAAQNKSASDRQKAQEEEDTNAQELKNWITGDFLTENRKAARSALGPGRVIQYMYKGEPYEKEVVTKKEQIEQVFQKKNAAENEEFEKLRWDKFTDEICKIAEEKNKQILHQQRELDAQLLKINTKIAEEHTYRETERNNISDLKPTEEFFDQFNRTTY